MLREVFCNSMVAVAISTGHIAWQRSNSNSNSNSGGRTETEAERKAYVILLPVIGGEGGIAHALAELVDIQEGRVE
jgi:hypothetical protein